MRTFLVFMAILVAGDEQTAIRGFIEDSVLLPCSCSQRNVDMDFQWQLEEPTTLLLKHNKNISKFKDTYNGRASVFLSENSDNCSLLLTNVTADDQGLYRCSFHIQKLYKKSFVDLTISARYNVCEDYSATQLPGNISAKTYHCVAEGRYREAEICWNLDGRLLKNSTTTRIMHTDSLDAHTGRYRFTSNLTTTHRGTSSPTCEVKADGVLAEITRDCSTMFDNLVGTEEKTQPPDTVRYRYLLIIPIALVLGLSLILWRRCRFSHREVDGNGV